MRNTASAVKRRRPRRSMTWVLRRRGESQSAYYRRLDHVGLAQSEKALALAVKNWNEGLIKFYMKQVKSFRTRIEQHRRKVS